MQMWLYCFLCTSLLKMDHPGVIMDLYVIYMVPGISVATHISQPHAAMVTHIQDPFLEFHNVLVRTHTLLLSLPFAAP